MGTTASSCIQLRCFQSSLSFSLPPVCLMQTVKDLLTLLHLHHPLLLSTQHHLQFRIIIQTLARPMLGATASTRTPTAAVRDDLINEGHLPLEDHCRVCHRLGDMVVCEHCNGPFHGTCL